ncbi:MAG: iron-sulfur cluster assembly scaffold protein [Bacteroidales bacterium]|nr:iron-sulfur cluster assembly scaffold protein [Bacteroidales bacterium]
MNEVKSLMIKSGYSDKAIDYYLQKINVGELKDPSIKVIYTGPCGDTMEIFLAISSNVIEDAKFQAIGCAGAFVSGSALMKMIKGKTLEQSKKINEIDVIDDLGGIPQAKIHCACLAVRTLRMAIEKFKGSE